MTDGGDCNIPDAFLKKRGDNNVCYCKKSTVHGPMLLLDRHFIYCDNGTFIFQYSANLTLYLRVRL